MDGIVSWAVVLQWLLWAVIVFAVMRWLHKSRARTRVAAEAKRLVQPLSILILSLICFAFFASIAIISNVFPNETATWWTTSVFVGFAFLSLLAVYGFFLEEHELSEEGQSSRSLVGVRKYLRWSDLHSVRYVRFLKWFRLEANSGTVARVSAMVVGLPEFARLLLERAPAGAIDAKSLAVLRATAAGDLPPL